MANLVRTQAKATCLECTFLAFGSAGIDIREWTPDCDAAMHCHKGHWKVSFHDDSRRDLYFRLRISRECEDFELADYAKEEKDRLERPD